MGLPPNIRTLIALNSEELVRLFDHLTDVQFWIKDKSGRYLYANRSFLLNYGLHAPNALLGKTDYDLSPAYLADQFLFDDEQVLRGSNVVDRIELVGDATGAENWNITNKFALRNKLKKIIATAGVTRAIRAADAQLFEGRKFQAVLSHIRDHYCEPLSNEHLARLAHMSVRNFERNFLKTFSATPQQYIRSLRIRLACRLLSCSDKSITEVALTCGYADQSHFAHDFTRRTGHTPRKYRTKYRQI